MKTKTEQILEVMKILAWVAAIGYAIEAGVILISYGMSCVNPEGAKNLYKGLNFYDLMRFSFWHYTLSVSFMVLLSAMKSYVWFLVISTISKINLLNPFKMEVAQKLERISYVLFGTWLVAMLAGAQTAWVMQITGKLYGNWVSGEFIFIAGLVFIISQIFKRGIEIQSEIDLTV